MKHFSFPGYVDRRTNYGGAMVEFTLVLPVLVLLIFAGIEFSRFISIKTKVTSICHDVGIEIYKRCQGESSPSQTQSCVQAETNDFYAKTQGQLPQTHHLNVQLFRASSPYSPTSPCPLIANHTIQSTTPPPSPNTHISTNPGTPLAALCSGLGVFDQSHEAIVTAEIHYVYEPILGFFAALFNFVPGSIYVGSVV